DLQLCWQIDRSLNESVNNSICLPVSAVESLEGPLLQVEGLSDLRLELHSKKMNMHLVLIDELHRHLYIKSTSKVGQRNKEKGRISSHVKDASALPHLDVTNLSTPRKFDSSQFSTIGNSSGEDLDLDARGRNSSPKLRKIQRTSSHPGRLEQELKQIVKRENVVQEINQRLTLNLLERTGKLLLELLELLFDKFNAVATAHAIVLGHLQQTVSSPSSQYDGDIKLYDMADVWVKIQDVLQVRNSHQYIPFVRVLAFELCGWPRGGAVILQSGGCEFDPKAETDTSFSEKIPAEYNSVLVTGRESGQ
uniref:Exocyst complex component Sec8 n=1 Tax=Laticauda laticaudata TaxID=8630 RepID=A0A8C5WQC6_LATLA